MSLELLDKIRTYELQKVLTVYGSDIQGKRILEIGSGRGENLRRLKETGADAVGVDIENGTCAAQKIEGITYYDGHTLPFEDASFDMVFSSSVLEHIPHLADFEEEMRRVLKPEGVALHILPTHWWRIWSMIVHYFVLPKLVIDFVMRRLFPHAQTTAHQAPPVSAQTARSKWARMTDLLLSFLVYQRHGERGNRLTEAFYFHPSQWRKHFLTSGWPTVSIHPIDIFYADRLPFASRLSLKHLRRLSHILGKVTAIYRIC